MKPVKLFYQERCPFCKKALRYIEELKAEYPEFQPIEIEMIEETQRVCPECGFYRGKLAIEKKAAE